MNKLSAANMATPALNAKVWRTTEEVGAKSDTAIANKVRSFAESTQRVECPPFPRYLMLELSNVCNHACIFCAYPDMKREKGLMDMAFMRKIAMDAYRLGAREVGLHTGAEPFANKRLEDCIQLCYDAGYEYIYISTNGSIPDKARLKRTIDSGLSSIKFSINAGNREVYKLIHGKDDFDKVVENVKFVSEYRKTIGRKLVLAISFVEVEENASSFAELTTLLGGVVDEIMLIKATNEAGQKDGYPPPPFKECDLPFNRVHVTREGYLRVCCNDYNNVLAMIDLNQVSLGDAWASQSFREVRRRHIADDLEGTLCHRCLKGCGKVAPLNPALAAV